MTSAGAAGSALSVVAQDDSTNTDAARAAILVIGVTLIFDSTCTGRTRLFVTVTYWRPKAQNFNSDHGEYSSHDLLQFVIERLIYRP
jgi:hypothetical protein